MNTECKNPCKVQEWSVLCKLLAVSWICPSECYIESGMERCQSPKHSSSWILSLPDSVLILWWFQSQCVNFRTEEVIKLQLHNVSGICYTSVLFFCFFVILAFAFCCMLDWEVIHGTGRSARHRLLEDPVWGHESGGVGWGEKNWSSGRSVSILNFGPSGPTGRPESLHS